MDNARDAIAQFNARAEERGWIQYCDPANAFVHVELRIGAGRDLATRERAAKHMFDALTAALADAFERTPIGISLELNEIVPETSHKRNNLHEYVEKRRNANV